jgi:hypothetical protein
MLTKKCCGASVTWGLACLAVVLLVTAWSCTQVSETPASGLTVKKMPAGKEFSGYLSAYDKLKPHPNFENTVAYVSEDPVKNVHKYVAIIVEPPALYVSTDSDEKMMPDRGRTAAVEYFQSAIKNAVADAFPVVQTPGPLVLRLRTALVGFDVGPAGQADSKDPNSLERHINIGKVGLELELVDSETGEQVAAAVDRANLGEGASIGSAMFTREEKFRAATDAFDGWASRLRQFLDNAHERSPEDIKRIKETNFPYASGANK